MKILNMIRGALGSPSPAQKVKTATGTSVACGGASKGQADLTKAEKSELKLNIKPGDPDFRELFHASASEQVVQLAVARAKEKGRLVSDDQLQALVEEDKRYCRWREFMLRHSDDNARKEFKEQFRQLAQSVNTGGQPAEDFFEKIDLIEEFARKRSTAKVEMRKITARCAAVAREMAVKVGRAAAELAAEQERAERTDAAQWGYPYEPSRAVLGLRKLAKSPGKCVTEFAGACRPSTLIAFTGININK